MIFPVIYFGMVSSRKTGIGRDDDKDLLSPVAIQHLTY